MNVLMIGPDRGVHGGISAVVNNYYAAGLDKKIKLKYIGTMKEGSKAYKLLVCARAYMSFCASLSSYDIVHVHLASDNSFWRKSLFIKKAYKKHKKIIIHQHGGDFKNYYKNQISDKKRAKMNAVLGMADRMIVLTHSWKEYFADKYDADRIHVIPNGVIIPENAAECVNTGHDMNKLLYLGRICTDKGIGELIDAVLKLKDSHPDIKLYIGGIYELKSDSDIKIKERIEQNPDVIKYLGWVSGDEKDALLKECGITLLPSYFEGFGMLIIESMCFGCVTIASDVGGIPEIITDEKDGILVPPKDSAAIAQKTAGIMNDPDRVNLIKQNAYQKILSNYSMDTVITELVSVYSEVAGSAT